MHLLTTRVESIKIGNGLLAGTEMGPLNNAAQMDRISNVVQEATNRAEGKILTGGSPVTGKEYENGFFYRPTLIADVPPDAAVPQGRDLRACTTGDDRP